MECSPEVILHFTAFNCWYEQLVFALHAGNDKLTVSFSLVFLELRLSQKNLNHFMIILQEVLEHFDVR